MNNVSVKALLKIGYYCNYSCNFCHAEYKKSIVDISLPALYLKILLLKNKGVETILLSGGEASLEPHFNKVILFIKKHGLSFGIVTNGSTISSESFLNKLDQNGIKNIYLSLHGFEDTHNHIVGDSKSFFKIGKIIEMMKARRHIQFSLNYVVTKENYKDILKTLEYLKNMGNFNLKIKFSMLEPEGAGKDEALYVSPKLSARSIKEGIDAYSKYFFVGWDGFPICLFSDYQGYRSDLKTENILYITEIYENKIFNTDYGKRSYISTCKSCDLKDGCYGIFSEYVNYFKKDDLVINEPKELGV